MSQYLVNQPYYYCSADGNQERELPRTPVPPTHPFTQAQILFGREPGGAGLAGSGTRETTTTCIGSSCDFSISPSTGTASQGFSQYGLSSGCVSPPTAHQQHQGTPQPSGAMSVGLKVFSPANRKEFKMYTLRNLQRNDFSDPATLKSEIFAQLGDEVVCGTLDFDMGYLIRNEKKWIHNAEDARDALAVVAGGGKLTLWCTGTNRRQGQKRPQTDKPEGGDEGERRKKKRSFTGEREERMTELVAKLRERHGAKYSQFQYRLWAEMFINETHKSLDEVPPYPMFGEERRPRVCSASGNSMKL